MQFPFGRAALAILIVTLSTGVWLLYARMSAAQIDEPDLVFITFTKEHAEAYRPIIAEFEAEKNVTVQLQVVDIKAVQGRLQSAIQAGAQTPDMVELIDGSLGFFTRGPIDDVGFVDLTDKIESSGLGERIIPSRFAMWSDRGHTFALPHDLHPVMLAYRRDLVEALEIDVEELTTWDKFAEVGRRVTQDTDGDGVVDHYMLDLLLDSGDQIRMFIAQHGGQVFDADGHVAFNSNATADVIEWYVKQCFGDTRIVFSCGWGQTLAKAMSDGLVLFYVTPDWRTRQFDMDVPAVGGRMDLMPLPAWEEGGPRTSTWGGTGLAFTRQVQERGKFDLAWELAMRLYYDPEKLGERFIDTNILPPVTEAFDLPELAEPRPFYSGTPIGREYAALAPDVPAIPSSPYAMLAGQKLLEAFTRSAQYYEANGEAGLREFIEGELSRAEEQVKRRMAHNVLYNADANANAEGEAGDE